MQETSRWQTVAVRTAWPSCEHEWLALCGREAVHEQRQWHLWHPQQCARMFPWHTPGSGASHGAGNQREVDEPRNTAAATHPVEAVFACASNAGVVLKEHEEYPRTSSSSHSARTERLPLEPCERDSPGLVLIHHRWALHFDACRYCERAWSPGSTVNAGSSLHAHFLSKDVVVAVATQMCCGTSRFTSAGAQRSHETQALACQPSISSFHFKVHWHNVSI